MACLSGNPDIVGHLITLGADVNYENSMGETVLMKACESCVAIVDKLLSHLTSDTDILSALTRQNKQGFNSFMKAASRGNLKVLLYLSEKIKKPLDNYFLGVSR